MSSTGSYRVRDLPRRWVAVAAVLGATLGYTLAVDPVLMSVEQVLYPLVWLGASGVALWLVADRVPALGWRSLVVGGGYTLLLLATAGLLALDGGGFAVDVYLAAPGWGPAVAYSGPLFRFLFVPFLVVGYLTLGLLAALAVQQTFQATAPGVLGLFACVSCTAPLLAALASSVGVGSVAAVFTRAQYPVATTVFLGSIGLFLLLLRRS